MARKRSFGRLVVFVILSVLAVLNLFPMYWMLQTSFTPKDAIMAIRPRLVPSRLTLENYLNLFHEGLIQQWALNSLIIAGSVTVFSVLTCSLAGYAFAKIPFPGRGLLFGVIIATMLIPGEVTLLPSFLLLQKIGLLGTLWAVIIPSIPAPFSIFMFRQYMSSIPDSLADAARIDGASEFRIFLQIMLPMSKPVLAAISIFTFISAWNSFLWPLIVLNDPSKYPLTVGLATLQEQHLSNFGLQMAGTALAAIPTVMIFFSFQKYFIKGLGAGSVKA